MKNKKLYLTPALDIEKVSGNVIMASTNVKDLFDDGYNPLEVPNV